jgi:hypothetical protein
MDIPNAGNTNNLSKLNKENLRVFSSLMIEIGNSASKIEG